MAIPRSTFDELISSSAEFRQFVFTAFSQRVTNRQLREFQRRNWIELHRGKLKLIDRNSLLDLAGSHHWNWYTRISNVCIDIQQSVTLLHTVARLSPVARLSLKPMASIKWRFWLWKAMLVVWIVLYELLSAWLFLAWHLLVPGQPGISHAGFDFHGRYPLVPGLSAFWFFIKQVRLIIL